MNTILFPTDFSDTSMNAAQYAFAFAKKTGIKKIILYHTYEVPVVTGDPIMPTLQMMDYESFKISNEQGLNHFHKKIVDEIDAEGIEIEAFCELGNLSDGINELCEKHNIDLIVMGITSTDSWEETLIGSNAITVAKEATVPVIIVPPEAKFLAIEKIMLACDFKKVIETTPVKPIIQLMYATKAKLYVLHVNHNNESYSPEMHEEIKMLDSLLTGLYPEFDFVDDEDFMNGVNEAVVNKQIDMLITIPKKHGFFENLFSKSHIKMLAFHSHIPLMVIHD